MIIEDKPGRELSFFHFHFLSVLALVIDINLLLHVIVGTQLVRLISAQKLVVLLEP